MTYTILGGTILTRQVKIDVTTPVVLIADGGATVVGIYATEVSGGTPWLSYYKTSGGLNFYLRNQKPMAARETWRDDVILKLKKSDTLMVQASAANQIDVLVSYIPGDQTEK